MRPSNLNSQPLISQKVKLRNVFCKMCLSHHDMINFFIITISLQCWICLAALPTLSEPRTRISHGLRCLVPRRLSLDENVRAKEGGKETTGFACRLYPSHGPLRFITSRSSTLRKTKRQLRRRMWPPWSLQSPKGCVASHDALQIPTLLAQQCWELLHPSWQWWALSLKSCVKKAIIFFALVGLGELVFVGRDEIQAPLKGVRGRPEFLRIGPKFMRNPPGRGPRRGLFPGKRFFWNSEIWNTLKL